MSGEEKVFAVLLVLSVFGVVVDEVQGRMHEREKRRLLAENARLRAEVRQLPRRGLRCINGGKR